MGVPHTNLFVWDLRVESPTVPRGLKRYYGSNDLHFITFSCYRRRQFLAKPSRRDMFLRALEKIASDYQLTIVGYVVMPEHVHLLVSEPERENLSTVIKALKQSVARRVKRQWRRKIAQQGLFPDSIPERFWQARFYDFNVWTEKKRVEKLRYIHRNPVTRGLVQTADEWRWSSFRFYAFGEKGVVTVNAIFPPKWARAAVAS
jgi:putative transposase